MRKIILVTALLFSVTGALSAQTYNANSGGYNTGYGHMYGSFGMAQASQNMYNLMQQIQMKNALDSTVRGSRSGSGRTTASKSSAVGTQPRVARDYGKFRPDATVDTGKTIGDLLGSTPEEKALLKQIYSGVKVGYDKEAAANGWQNNFAGAFTFFIVSNLTVYHDSTEPSDDTVRGLYQTMSEVIDSIPEFGKMSNRDKQAFNNMLIAFAAIPLATYSEGKENGDAATLKASRDLAGQLIEMVLKADPEKMRFDAGGLTLGS
jgi:hypothetical protein